MNDIDFIYTNPLEETIRCAMCTNPMRSDTGCDGGCKVDERIYKRVINAVEDLITTATKNATNGDIVKTMFPRFEIYENRDNKDYPYVDVIITEHDSTCYPKDWWDEPYKRGGEDGKETTCD